MPADVDYAVVVGVDHYPAFRSLHGAINDAREFHKWLCDKNGGGLASENVKWIESNLRNRTPVQDEIDQVLEDVLQTARDRNGARRLYFYFSGHGAGNDENDDVALLLTRWSRSLERVALSIGGYSDALCRDRSFQELAVFIDCCRSVEVPVIGLPPLFRRGRIARPLSTSKFIAYASEPGKPAYEIQYPERCRGIFTQCLLTILRRETNPIRAHVLRDCLEREVATAAAERGIVQRPRVETDFSDRIGFGCGGAAQVAEPVLVMTSRKRSGKLTVREGRLNIIAELDPVPRVDSENVWWQLPLPPGLYKIEGGGAPPIILEHNGREEPHAI